MNDDDEIFCTHKSHSMADDNWRRGVQATTTTQAAQSLQVVYHKLAFASVANVLFMNHKLSPDVAKSFNYLFLFKKENLDYAIDH